MDQGQRQASVALPAATTAPRDARRFTVETLRSWGALSSIEEAELIVSELVTNALRHASSPTRVALAADGDCLRIEVADLGQGGAVRRRAAPEDTGGRGLLLVEAMADRWGSHHDGHEHVVWCEIPL
jgi:anti-sigma regulatory factor (Ser/Thr protein kinase)